MVRCLRGLFVLSILTFLFQTLVFSQEADFEAKNVQRETRKDEAVSKMAKAAREKQALESLEKVTYAQVLKEPDNVNLNFRFAKQQVKDNNLLGAASTLERILLVNPNLHQVRLFYAVVLFRLDNLTEATRELNLLESAEISASMSSEVKAYQKKINTRRRRTHFSLRESVGYEIDTNRNAAPSSKMRLASDVTVGLTDQERKRRDTSFLNITTVDVAHDLGTQAGHQLLGSFTYYLQEQTSVDSLDMSSYNYDLGGVYRTKWFNFTPRFYAGNLLLSRETFLRTQGGFFQIDRNLFNRFDIFVLTTIERQDFSGITENPTARERKGRKFDLAPGVSVTLTPTMRWTSALFYTDKSAEEEYNGYGRIEMRNAHTWLLGKGQFLINSFDAGFDRYDEVDNGVAGRIRRDKTLRYRVTYGAPLTFFLIGKILPAPLKDMTLSFSYEYFRELANITNYSYTNNKFQTFLTKRWEF